MHYFYRFDDPPNNVKHWRKMVRHPDSSQSHQDRVTMLQLSCMYEKKQTKANKCNIHTNKHSEWSQWHEAKSGTPNLWAAQIIVNCGMLLNTSTRKQFWLLTKAELRCGQMEFKRSPTTTAERYLMVQDNVSVMSVTDYNRIISQIIKEHDSFLC